MSGYRDYRASAVNAARLLNRLTERGIGVFRVQKTDKYLLFRVKTADCPRAEQLMNEWGSGFEVVRTRSAATAAKTLARHAALPVTAILCVVAIAIGSLFCYDVEIEGADGETAMKIREIVHNNTGGVFLKSSADTDDLAREILAAVDGAAFAQASYRGGKLVVSVVMENETHDETTQFSRIVAAEDGIVTRVLTESGTALVKEGDRIVKGQVLIDGYMDMGDPADPNNERVPVPAAGQVFARVWRQEHMTVPTEQSVAVRTGETAKRTKIALFGREIGKSEPPFENYEAVTTRRVTGIWFPITVTTTVYYETARSIIPLAEEDVDAMIARRHREMAEDIPAGAILTRAWSEKKRVDNLYLIDVYCELESTVGIGEV